MEATDNLSEEDATGYEAPKVLQFLRAPAAFLRGQYSTNFADVVSTQVEVQDTYEDGLVALASFIGGFVVIWGLVLVYFMIKGKAVGCASGRAFDSEAVVDDNSQKGSSPSANASEDDTHSVKEEEELGGCLETESFSSSLCSSDAASRFESTTSFDMYTVDASHRLEGPRAMRTRIVFFIFACTVLACVPLALAFSFAPMKETAKSFDGRFDEVDDIFVQVRAALSTISTASHSAMGILSQTSTNASVFCPNINNTQFNKRLGRNLLRLSEVLSVEYVDLDEKITDNMTEIEDILETIEDASDVVEVSFNRAEGIIWFVPGLLLAVSIVTALATFGVILACKQESGLRLQRCMSYGVLPALIALCILCWILGIVTTVTTAMSADFCLPVAGSGTPDATVRNMLLTHGDLPNSTKHQFLGAYTSGCTGSEPALLIVELERASQDKVDEIWAHISSVDSFGRSALSEECGGSGLDELLSASRNIAKLLTKVRRALDSASDSLMCERIDPLYTATIHGTICTDFAEASAWGAITFCLLGVSMMVLITLRASWRLRIDEDKIYHDESEVAENMVVDEHEEYLRYISRYRHEWQEYNGFGSTSMKKSTSFSASEDEDDGDFDSHSGSGSRGEGETTSMGSGEISFPSLDVPPTDESSADQSQVVPMPPPILKEGRRQRAIEATHNQEVMLCPEHLSRPLGGQKCKGQVLMRGSIEREEEKTEVEPQAMETNADDLSAHTEESTDFSSIGKNAGRSPGHYWKNHILGIEVVNASSVSDSLVVSPNSDGASSFELNTPSPNRTRASFDALPDKMPTIHNNSLERSPYTRKPSNGHDSDSTESEPERKDHRNMVAGGRFAPDPLPLRKVSSESAAGWNKERKLSPRSFLPLGRKSLKVETHDHSFPSPPPTPSPRKSTISDPLMLRRASSYRPRPPAAASSAQPLHRARSTGSESARFHSDSRAHNKHLSMPVDPPPPPPPKSSPPARVRRTKLMDLMQKFDPTTVVSAEDLHTI